MDIKQKPRRAKKSVTKRQKPISSEGTDLLEGLEVDGKYVLIDNNLIKRLKSTSEKPTPVIQCNPFKDCPDFTECLKNGTPVTLDLIDKYSKKFYKSPASVNMADLLGNFPLEFLSLKYGEMKSENWDYSIKVSNPPKVSNQEAAGLCWVHAATNVLRYDIIKKFQTDSKFELSQSYLYFYDKIERCNLFFENVWQLRYKGIRDFQVFMATSPSSDCHLLSDGGMYSFFSNLIGKYGIVPKNVYGGSVNCRSSQTMNDALMKILVRMVLPFFTEKWTREQFDTYKDECMTTIYDVVVRFLGEPPKPTDTFDWTYKDENGETRTIKHLTPEKFYRIIVPHDDNKITIIHDPRHPETQYMSSWVEYGLNMHGNLPTSLINLPLDAFKRVVCESLKNDEAVWFACDVNNGFDTENKTWDTKRYDYERVLGTPLEFDKADMLETLASRSVHAMVIGGVDVVQNDEGKVTEYKKWRIFNSWGMDEEDVEMDSGFYRMTDAYFDRYVSVAVVDLKYFEPEEAKLILENAQAGKCFSYKFTDAFGAVAFSSCSHCKK